MRQRGLAARDEAVSGTIVAFLVAGVIFIGVVAGALLSGRHATEAPSQAQSQVDLQLQARNLGQVLVGSAGYAAGGDWASQPGAQGALPGANSLVRLGLGDATSSDPTMLSFSKFQNLRRAPYASDPTDGYVNYGEARTSLGLDSGGLNFHLRAYPSLRSVEDLLAHGIRDPNLRVTYIGDIAVSSGGGAPPPSNPAQGLTVTQATCTVSTITPPGSPQNYRVAVDVTNGGTTATQFSALFRFSHTGTPVAGHTDPTSRTADSYLVPAGATTTLYVGLPATTSNGACDRNSIVTVAVQDPGTTQVTSTTTFASTVSGATAAPVDLLVAATKPTFLNPTGATSGCQEQVRFYYDGPDKNTYVYLKVTDSAGATRATVSMKVPASSSQRTLGAGCLPAGEYLATLYYCGASACTGGTALTQVNAKGFVATALPARYTSPSAPPPSGSTQYTPSVAAQTEVDFLSTLIDRFCPYYFDSATSSPLAAPPSYAGRCASFKGAQPQPGDVFPASKQVMNNDLPNRLLDAAGLPRYDIVNVLVAGSNVNQNSMTSQAAKGAVADWVMGGGTLVVFGSSSQNVNWLEPIFHAAIRSSSGGLGVPDPDHPLLHSSDELDYPHYDNQGRVWNFNGQTALEADQIFTNIVVQGSDPVTTESNAGAMGAGSVILTTWQGFDPYHGSRDPATARLEGLKLTNNLLMQGYRDLFLDYGPPLPPNTDVVPSVRMVQIQHPEFPDPIQVAVKVFVFH